MHHGFRSSVVMISEHKVEVHYSAPFHNIYHYIGFFCLGLHNTLTFQSIINSLLSPQIEFY